MLYILYCLDMKKGCAGILIHPHPPLPLMTDTNGKSRQERTTENGEVKQAMRPDKVALYTTLTSRRGEQMVRTHHGVPPI